MGLRDRLFGKGEEEAEPAQAPPAADDEAAMAERAAQKAHMDAMLARGSMTEREYRQEHRRLFGHDGL